MKLNKLILSAITAVSLYTGLHINAEPQAQPANQTTLFYMYSNEEGHYFLDPEAEYENVIFVPLDDYYLSSPHHGDKFIGTFSDTDLWELEGLEAVE